MPSGIARSEATTARAVWALTTVEVICVGVRPIALRTPYSRMRSRTESRATPTSVVRVEGGVE
jgi:hypothetical protein